MCWVGVGLCGRVKITSSKVSGVKDIYLCLLSNQQLEHNINIWTLSSEQEEEKPLNAWSIFCNFYLSNIKVPGTEIQQVVLFLWLFKAGG